MKEGDLATARERALALKEWLDRGGFYPPNYTEVEVRSYLANVLRHTAGIRADDDEEETP